MTSIEIFKRFQLKFDTLNTEDNIDISPGEFCLMFNEQQTKFIKREYQNRSSRYIDDIQSLIVTNEKLNQVEEKEEGIIYTEVILPDNYLDYITSLSIADKDNCKNKTIKNFEVKMVDLNVFLNDEFSKPSFEFEETILTISNNKLQVYTNNDFTITSILLTYYRIPTQIDIEGYIKLDGTNSVNIDSDLSDDLISEILDLTVLEASRNYNDLIKSQITQLKNQENKNL